MESKDKPKGKGSIAKKIIIITFILLALIISSVGGYIGYMLNKTKKTTIATDNKNLGISQEAEEKSQETLTTFAVFGIDAPKGKKGRSDAILLITIDNRDKSIKLTSIMRDSYVDIQGHGKDKINHAYSFGGPELAIKTLNSNFKLDVRKYVTVNLTTLPDIIDTLGGVEVKVKDYELEYLEKLGVTEAGMHNLNGEQALAYSRIRYSGNGDFERTERHRTILEALFKKVMILGVFDIAGYMDKLLPLLETNLSNGEIVSLCTTVLTMGSPELEQNRFPKDDYSQGKSIRGVYYLIFDLEKTTQDIQDFIYN